jgi:hypothetical protein
MPTTPIANRGDLTHAKALFDNLDTIGTVLGILKGKTGVYSLAVAPGMSITFDIVDIVGFLTTVQTNTTAKLNAMGVTVS